MILCFHFEDLSKIFLVSKFDTNWPNIYLAYHNISCHTVLLELKGINLQKRTSLAHFSSILTEQSSYLSTGSVSQHSKLSRKANQSCRNLPQCCFDEGNKNLAYPLD